MAQRQYDAQGNLISRTETTTDRVVQGAGQAIGLAALAIMAAIIAPFIPILWLGYQAFQWLTSTAEWHELFAGILALCLIAGAGWLLWRFKWVRIPYFGAEVLFASWFTFNAISEKNDAIWGGFFALIVLAIGIWVMRLIEQEFDKRFA